MSEFDDVQDNNEPEFISKTQLKQEAKELVDLGKKLVDLRPNSKNLTWMTSY